jgi:hypothetical protein
MPQQVDQPPEGLHYTWSHGSHWRNPISRSLKVLEYLFSDVPVSHLVACQT